MIFLLLVGVLAIPGSAVSFVKNTVASKSQHQLDSLLFHHIGNGDLAGVKRAIEAGANLNSTGPDSKTPLMLAASLGNCEIAYTLLDAGADITAKDASGNTAIKIAVGKGDSDMLLTLAPFARHSFTQRETTDHIPQVDSSNELGVTPLVSAIYQNDNEMARALIKAGADVNRRGRRGSTPLSIAAKFGNENVVRTLLEAGVDTEATGSKGVPVAERAEVDPKIRDLIRTSFVSRSRRTTKASLISEPEPVSDEISNQI